MGHNITQSPKVKSMGHNGSSGVLITLVSVVIPGQLPGQKGVTNKMKKKNKKQKNKNKKKNMNFGEFLTFFKNNSDMTIYNFLMSMCSFCGGQHTDTNI